MFYFYFFFFFGTPTWHMTSFWHDTRRGIYSQPTRDTLCTSDTCDVIFIFICMTFCNFKPLYYTFDRHKIFNFLCMTLYTFDIWHIFLTFTNTTRNYTVPSWYVKCIHFLHLSTWHLTRPYDTQDVTWDLSNTRITPEVFPTPVWHLKSFRDRITPAMTLQHPYDTRHNLMTPVWHPTQPYNSCMTPDTTLRHPYDTRHDITTPIWHLTQPYDTRMTPETTAMTAFIPSMSPGDLSDTHMTPVWFSSGPD